MAMSVDSNSSPLALRKDHDSVESEKDFDPPIKKLKVDGDLAGEEDNTDSVPKVASLKEREPELFKLFKFFQELFQKTYSDQEEEDYRFSVFKENLERPPTPTIGLNRPGFADLTPRELELDGIQIGRRYNFYCSTSVSYFQELRDKYHRQCHGSLSS